MMTPFPEGNTSLFKKSALTENRTDENQIMRIVPCARKNESSVFYQISDLKIFFIG